MLFSSVYTVQFFKAAIRQKEAQCDSGAVASEGPEMRHDFEKTPGWRGDTTKTGE